MGAMVESELNQILIQLNGRDSQRRFTELCSQGCGRLFLEYKTPDGDEVQQAAGHYK